MVSAGDDPCAPAEFAESDLKLRSATVEVHAGARTATVTTKVAQPGAGGDPILSHGPLVVRLFADSRLAWAGSQARPTAGPGGDIGPVGLDFNFAVDPAGLASDSQTVTLQNCQTQQEKRIAPGRKYRASISYVVYPTPETPAGLSTEQEVVAQ